MSALQPFNRRLESVPHDRRPAQIPLDNRFELRQGLRVIAAKRWLLLAFVLAVGLIASVVSWQIKPVYLSTVTVMMESGKSKILPTDQAYDEGPMDAEKYLTQIEIMKSREVARRTVKANRLWEFPDFNPQKRAPAISSRVMTALGLKPPEPPLTDELLLENATDLFIQAVTIEPVRLSSLVKVGVETSNRQLSAKLADSLAQVFIDNDREARFKIAQNLNVWLEQRMVDLKEKLDKSEDALQSFRDKQGILDVGSSTAQSVAGQQMADIEQRLLQARVRRTELESSYQQIQQSGDNDYRSIPELLSNVGVLDARRRVTEATRRVNDMSAQYGPQYAGLQQAQAERAAAEEQLKQQSRAVIESISHEYRSALRTERALAGAVASARNGVRSSNQYQFQLSRLEREVESNKQLYEVLQSRAKETQLASNVQTAVARVVDPASPYGQQVRPNRTRLVLTSLIAALVAGMMLIVAGNRFDKTIKVADEAEHRLQIPLLASLPDVGVPDSSMLRLFLDEPQSAYAEAIRIARAAVLFAHSGKLPKIILVTSSMPGEGSTSFAANLALAHAQTKSTLLVDANLRTPAAGQRYGLRPDAKGFTDLVSGLANPTECIHAIPGTNLLVLPAGLIPSNPQELLLSQRFEDALTAISQKIEVIIIDSPPMERYLDATLIASRASAVIYVVKALETPYTMVRKHLSALDRAGGSILGAVLNRRTMSLGNTATPRHHSEVTQAP